MLPYTRGSALSYPRAGCFPIRGQGVFLSEGRVCFPIRGQDVFLSEGRVSPYHRANGSSISEGKVGD